MELHTFSSLNKTFLQEYSGCMSETDEAIVYFNPKTIHHKGLETITKQDVEEAFLPSKVIVYDDANSVTDYLKSQNLDNSVVLLMTSGNFDGLNLNDFAQELV